MLENKEVVLKTKVRTCEGSGVNTHEVFNAKETIIKWCMKR
jgi:hypothetical protein